MKSRKSVPTANAPANPTLPLVGKPARGLSVELDIYRAIAALAVVAGHVRGLFFVPYSETDHSSFATAFWYAVTSLGHQAVMVFFVLSGFLVGGSAVRLIKASKWSWREYLQRRLTRLYVVLLPALLLTAIWDQLGMSRFGASVYGGTHSEMYILPYAVARVSTWKIWLGNLLFLQDIYVPSFGSNVPLWSLSYEFWYYLLFPFSLLALMKAGQPTRRVIYGLIAAAIAVMIGWKVAGYFIIWCLGVGVAVASDRRSAYSPSARWPFYVFVAAALIIARFKLTGSVFVADLFVGVAFALLLFAVVQNSKAQRVQKPLPNGIAPMIAGFAGFSYTLYLSHAPILVFLHVWLFSRSQQLWQPDLRHFMLGSTILIGVLLYAWSLSLVTERRTDAIRRWITNSSISLSSRRDYASTPVAGKVS